VGHRTREGLGPDRTWEYRILYPFTQEMGSVVGGFEKLLLPPRVPTILMDQMALAPTILHTRG